MSGSLPRKRANRVSSGVIIESLTDSHDRAKFDCGTDSLDRYLRTQASQDVAKRVAATFILTEPPSRIALGFYILAASSVFLQELPPATIRRLPKYPKVPVILLGRLAVDRTRRGLGYGEMLLLDALVRSLAASATIGAAAVIVDAKDDAARQFYAHFGFDTFVGQPRRLFIAMGTVAALGLDQQA